MFPEGEISTDLELMPGKTGVARLAATTGVPVTPMGVWGSQRVHAKGRKPKVPWGIRSSIVVGPPITVAPEDDVFDATDRIMDRDRRVRRHCARASTRSRGERRRRVVECAHRRARRCARPSETAIRSRWS